MRSVFLWQNQIRTVPHVLDNGSQEPLSCAPVQDPAHVPVVVRLLHLPLHRPRRQLGQQLQQADAQRVHVAAFLQGVAVEERCESKRAGVMKRGAGRKLKFSNL